MIPRALTSILLKAAAQATAVRRPLRRRPGWVFGAPETRDDPMFAARLKIWQAARDRNLWVPITLVWHLPDSRRSDGCDDGAQV